MSEAACPFCNPDAGRVFAEGPLVRAVWDAFPVSEGHALICPKRHISSWFDAGFTEYAAALELLAEVRAEIDQRYGPDGYNLGINDGSAAGQTVPHAHLHVIPRYRGDVEDPTGGVRGVIADKANYLGKSPATPPSQCDSDDAGVAPEEALSASRGDSSAGADRRLVVGGTGDPLLPRLVEAFDSAREVDILAAFVMQSGVRLIGEHLTDVLDRGGRVRILTGDYLSVTEPAALRMLLDLDGDIEVRIMQSGSQSFHPKAYVISQGPGSGLAFVGSSNLSRSALIHGVEWNYRVQAEDPTEGLDELTAGFEQLWNDSRVHAVDESWVHSYEERRERAPDQEAGVVEEPEPLPVPHELQAAALEALEQTRLDGNTAGLVVLATGLGKTWLSAFDTRRAEFKKVLFVAHREEILRQAMKTFRRIRPDAAFGTYSGEVKDVGVDVLFASIQTLSRTQHLNRFDPREFDYIVVDEFHHAAARTYQRLIGYFEPKFLLGLTATPERTDGADLLALCGDNLVYRADLEEGIAKGRLAPFDYFGVPDLVDYDNIPWRSSRFDEEALTREVATQERAQNALDQLRKHGGERTLAFCVSQRHADFMKQFLVDAGVRAAVVHSGEGSDPRAHSLEKLQSGELDVVCAVDMFNEGVDLPDLDTVLMLRPTESRILWLQQFGRGLRHREGKTLKVIDYIGNHKTFLTKTQALLGLGNAEREVAHALEKLDAGEWELPPGCSVTYDLEAKEILLGLIPKAAAGDRLEQYYRDYREARGVRPLASQAYQDGYNPRSTRKAGRGSWLEFVEMMGDLTADEAAAYDELRHFLERLETTSMSKSYKMVVLLVMLGADRIPGRMSLDELVERFQDRVRRYTPLRDDLGDKLENPTALRRLIVSEPLKAWTGTGAMGGRIYFDFDGDEFGTTFEVPPALRDSAANLIREIAEWRLLEYLRRNAAQNRLDHFVCRVSHTNARPIIFLPSRDKVTALPEGWTDLVAGGEQLQGNFVKVALNVVTRPGESTNVLPGILRGWFGEEAGLPGRSDHVVFRRQGDAYEMTPLREDYAEVKGPQLWQRYTRKEAFEKLEITATGWDRQMGVLERPDKLVFFVTLDKSGKEQAHQYKDKFLSPTEFQWQSQNRTARTSELAQRFKASPPDSSPIHLFVRKSAKVGGKTEPFTYAGELTFSRWDGDNPITIWWDLQQPIPPELRSDLGLSD